MKAFHVLVVSSWPLVLLAAIVAGIWLGFHFGAQVVCTRREERLEMTWNPSLGIPVLEQRSVCIEWAPAKGQP